MSNHYPERLGLVICVNHNAVFQGVWRAIKVFLHPNTTAKMQLVRSKKKIKEVFGKYFSEELSHWLLEEMSLNKQKPLPVTQREFWKGPKDKLIHDPRGCKSYVDQYVNKWNSKDAASIEVHQPHPNIVDFASGKVKAIKHPSPEIADGAHAIGANEEDDITYSSDSEENGVSDMVFDEEFQIPENAAKVQG